MAKKNSQIQKNDNRTKKTPVKPDLTAPLIEIVDANGNVIASEDTSHEPVLNSGQAEQPELVESNAVPEPAVSHPGDSLDLVTQNTVLTEESLEKAAQQPEQTSEINLEKEDKTRKEQKKVPFSEQNGSDKKDNTRRKGTQNSGKVANSVGNGLLAQAILKQVSQKERVSERNDVDLVEVQQEENRRSEARKNASGKETYKVDENYRKEVLSWKNVLQRMGLGLLLGVSAVVPTNSSSTLLGITKKYDDVLYNLRNCFKKNNARQWGLILLWVLPLIVVWFGAFILMYYIIYKISNVGFGPAMMIGFSGFTVFSIPIYILVNKIPMIKNIHQLGRGSMDQKPKIGVIVGTIAFLFTLLLGLISRFAWESGSTSAITPGLSLQAFDYNSIAAYYPKNFNNVIGNDNQTEIAFLGIVANFIAGLVVLVPGISSGIILSTFGRWTQLNYAVQVGFGSHLPATQALIGDGYTMGWAWPIIIVSAIGAVGGFIASLFLLSWIKNKWGDYFNIFCLGLMIGSLFSTYIAISPYDYYQLGHDPRVLGCALGLFFGMVFPAGGIFIYLNEKNHIQVQKLRINHLMRKQENRKNSNV